LKKKTSSPIRRDLIFYIENAEKDLKTKRRGKGKLGPSISV